MDIPLLSGIMVNDEDRYLYTLIISVSNKFKKISQSYEDSASVLEKEIKYLCSSKSSEKYRVYYDKLSDVFNIVSLRKKAFMYKLISEILKKSVDSMIVNKKKIGRNKKKLEDFVNGKIDLEEATNLILTFLKNVLGIDISKDKYYEVGEYEAKKHFENICS